MSEPVLLNYAPAKRSWRKRIVRIFIALSLLIVTIGTWRWGPYAWHQSQTLYWQRQCMNFTAPPDMVVYDEDPQAAAKLLNDPNYSPCDLSRRYIAGDAQLAGVIAACFGPGSWQRFLKLVPPSMDPLAPSRSPRPVTVLFLHELVSPLGHHRLVCVNYGPDQNCFTQVFVDGMNYRSSVAVPATWMKSATWCRRSDGFSGTIGWPKTPPRCRIYAGQIDPNDPSHFTVRYQMWDQEDILDGRLTDNDDVTLTARHVPKEPGR